MNEDRRLSPEGAELVKSFESCLRPTGPSIFVPYICPAGRLTIGWGHTNDHGRHFDHEAVWSQADCDHSFEEDMRHFERAVQRLVKVNLTQHQFDALVSFTYNCGEGNLQKSTLLRKVNAEDFEGAAREFSKWNRGGGRVLRGLTRRRAAEALLFQNVDHEEAGASWKHKPEPMPQQVDPPEPPKTMTKSKTGWAAGIPGAAGASEIIAQAKEAIDNTVGNVSDTVRQAHDIADGLGLWDVVQNLVSNPAVLISVALVAAAGFIWWDRRRKLYEEHV